MEKPSETLETNHNTEKNSSNPIFIEEKGETNDNTPTERQSWGKQIRDFFGSFSLIKKDLGTGTEELSNTDTEILKKEMRAMEGSSTIKGVDLSRANIKRLIKDRDSGKEIEFETLSQYICDYNMATGEIREDILTNADKIGLRLGKTFRDIFPKAKLISLWDAYNTCIPDSSNERGMPVAGGKQIVIDDKVQENFKNNSIALQKKAGGIPKDGIEGVDYEYISESSKIHDAEKLVKRLEKAGFIEENSEEINFVNKEAENPLYRKINLRTKNGRWLCEALDASAFVPENQDKVHIVVLPDYFKEQQDKVWEMLRVQGIKPDNYHNIFYDDTRDPEEIAKTIEEEFARYQI